MTRATPPDQRAARRALIRQLHPDRGGDVSRFVEVMAALDESHAPPAPATVRATFAGSRRRLFRTVRTALPRRLPGAKRYATY